MSFLTKKFLDPRPATFGLDLSDLSIKVMQIIHERQHDHIKGFATAKLPLGTISDGVIVKKDVVIEAIKTTVERAGITTPHVICSLPETKAFLRVISIPHMTPEEAREAVKWEMEANIPMTLDQVYHDWQILEEPVIKEKGHMNVLVVAVARSIVDMWLGVLRDAGLQVHGFDIESIAQARSLLSADGDKQTSMIVDIGDRRTSFLIAVDSAPVFTSSIPLSSESMTDAIAKSMNLSHAEAEKIKINHGIGSIVKDDHIFHALKPVLENFVTEIDRSIEFFVTGMRYAKTVDQIILCGGGAKTKGIIPYFSRRLQKNITLGNPWKNVHLDTIPPVTRENAVQYSTVVGLAIKDL